MFKQKKISEKKIQKTDMFQVKSDTEHEGKGVKLNQKETNCREIDREKETAGDTIIIIASVPVPITEPEKPVITQGRVMGEMRSRDDREQRACTIT